MSGGERDLSGGALKQIALLTMLTDHLAYGFYGPVFARHGWLDAYSLMRTAGRLAFPLFCFLLVTGFQKTRSRRRYLLRLTLFALASEIPFDLAFENSVLEFGYQNVGFTLLLGFLAMGLLELWEILKMPYRVILSLLTVGGFMMTAHLISCDYAEGGVLLIALMYLFRNDEKLFPLGVLAGIIWLCVVYSWSELPAVIALLLIWRFDGSRGKMKTAVPYIFYPAHLLAIWLLRRLIFGI